MDQQTGSSLRNGFHGIEASLDLRESRCTRSQKCTNDRVVAISGVLLISDRGIPWRCEFDGVRRGENRPICVHTVFTNPAMDQCSWFRARQDMSSGANSPFIRYGPDLCAMSAILRRTYKWSVRRLHDAPVRHQVPSLEWDLL